MEDGCVKNYKIDFLPDARRQSVLEKGEIAAAHTPYETENAFYSCIEAGDEEGVKKSFGSLLGGGVVVGRMSSDPLRQVRYFAVCCITLACRHAIRGGLDESTAFGFSDECIMTVDNLSDADEIVGFLFDRAVELTRLTGTSDISRDAHAAVKKCAAYIGRHLHDKLTAAECADYCGLSPDYLTVLFKKHTGRSLSRFIADRKLSAAKAMLRGGYSVAETAYGLGFASESHFIVRFREVYGITPGVYVARCKASVN